MKNYIIVILYCLTDWFLCHADNLFAVGQYDFIVYDACTFVRIFLAVLYTLYLMFSDKQKFGVVAIYFIYWAIALPEFFNYLILQVYGA